jgi:hypothetical protein
LANPRAREHSNVLRYGREWRKGTFVNFPTIFWHYLRAWILETNENNGLGPCGTKWCEQRMKRVEATYAQIQQWRIVPRLVSFLRRSPFRVSGCSPMIARPTCSSSGVTCIKSLSKNLTCSCSLPRNTGSVSWIIGFVEIEKPSSFKCFILFRSGL